MFGLGTIISFFFSPLGKYLAIALVIFAAFSGTYVKGRFDGGAKVQAKWDRAVQAAIVRGERARSAAESNADRLPDDLLNRDNAPR